ncbi:iron ABC transporter permease [Salipaludibacillus neizhouensis]|uniref:Iron ABC transporter permease n=2 Tax=Salipaludibacillus neizhouensis TaxID=885475 RepID=A0A3A9K947_9BACI|nr:iron ABC transporter permease [Salipaludibacillus neizhouensis]RKL67340.1 iron ABC transporter permease [Salipaludibacillus neizhouensis]
MSFQIETKTVLILLGLCISLFLALILGPSLGNKLLSPLEVVRTIAGVSTGGNDFIVMNSRLPRTLVSILTGAALGLSGLILQGVIRNPLAAPDIIGVTGGSSVAAVAFITYLSGTLSLFYLPLAAVSGGIIVSVFIYMMSWKNGVTPIRLILIGIGVSAVMSAGTTFMLVLSPSASAGQAYLWLTGSVYGASWEDVRTVAIVILVITPLVLLFSRSLNAQQFGDEVASGLGVKVEFHRMALLLFSVILAGVAVSAAGAIGFVGLIAPHIARALIGRQFAGLILSSALVGGLLVFSADLVARTVFYPIDIPAGVFTAGIGAPFFLYLLFKNRHQF